MKNIEFGVVAVLDVLGMKNYSVANSIQFIEKRDELIQSVCESSTNFFEQLKIVPKIKIATFGDTIIICWPTNDENLIGYNLLGMSHLMKLAICWGISKKIFFRGSMSVGEYFSHGQTILGPAINDAVSWCEEANWFGVIFTPNCKYCAVSSLIEESPFNDIINKLPLKAYFIEYPVPFSTVQKETLAVSWPIEYLAVSRKNLTPMGMLSGFLSDVNIPKGTELKYDNAVKFFNWYQEEIYPEIEDKFKELYAV